MNWIRDAIFKDRYTTIVGLLAVAALVAFGMYTNQLNAAQVVSFILTTALGLGAADSKKGGQQ